ncbi:MAG TPA: hypothetical protein VGG39_11790 [Polyangiaceae bacterium]
MSPSLLRALGAAALAAVCAACGGTQTGVSDARIDGCRRDPSARTGCLEVAPNNSQADDGTPSTVRSTSKDRVESEREEQRMHASAPRPTPSPRSAPPPRGGGGGVGGFHPPPHHVGAY